MILFLSGVGASIGLLVLAYGSFMLGKKHHKTMKLPEVNEDELRKQQQILADFNELMNYNEKKAYERKRAY